ncbi:hypothetical protein P0F65_00130 [Sphingomonas sp. I4]
MRQAFDLLLRHVGGNLRGAHLLGAAAGHDDIAGRRSAACNLLTAAAGRSGGLADIGGDDLTDRDDDLFGLLALNLDPVGAGADAGDGIVTRRVGARGDDLAGGQVGDLDRGARRRALDPAAQLPLAWA